MVGGGRGSKCFFFFVFSSFLPFFCFFFFSFCFVSFFSLSFSVSLSLQPLVGLLLSPLFLSFIHSFIRSNIRSNIRSFSCLSFFFLFSSFFFNIIPFVFFSNVLDCMCMYVCLLSYITTVLVHSFRPSVCLSVPVRRFRRDTNHLPSDTPRRSVVLPSVAHRLCERRMPVHSGFEQHGPCSKREQPGLIRFNPVSSSSHHFTSVLAHSTRLIYLTSSVCVCVLFSFLHLCVCLVVHLFVNSRLYQKNDNALTNLMYNTRDFWNTGWNIGRRKGRGG